MISATGTYEGLVLSELKKRGVTVVALVQDGDKAKKAKEAGTNGTVIENQRQSHNL